MLSSKEDPTVLSGINLWGTLALAVLSVHLHAFAWFGDFKPVTSAVKGSLFLS